MGKDQLVKGGVVARLGATDQTMLFWLIVIPNAFPRWIFRSRRYHSYTPILEPNTTPVDEPTQQQIHVAFDS